jgi:hypothetical protein
MNFFIKSLIGLIFNLIIVCSNMSNKQANECYESLKGFYENKYHEYNSHVKCSTYCYAYRETLNNQSLVGASCGEDETCMGSVFVVKYNYAFSYNCCQSNLCNSQDFIHKNLDYKCEFGKKVTKSMKLAYPISINLKSSGVKQCYYCQQCTSSSYAKIINCKKQNRTVKNFACMVMYYFLLLYTLY